MKEIFEEPSFQLDTLLNELQGNPDIGGEVISQNPFE